MAPNPYYGVCTLAVCKPQIRKYVLDGDWVVGLSPRSFGNKLVYAMKVSEVLSFATYYRDPEYSQKIPNMRSDDYVFRVGDNFYQPLENGTFKQLWSRHSNPDGTENEMHKTRDLSGVHVLVGRDFYYFGSASIKLPASLEGLIVRRGHRITTEQNVIRDLQLYLDHYSKGIHGYPSLRER